MRQKNGGKINGSYDSIYWGVSSVISVIYETIIHMKGGQNGLQRRISR